MSATQRVAIPVFGLEVAPRFRFAAHVLVADLEEGQVSRQCSLDLGDLGWRARLCLLATRRVTLLACGGFDRLYLPFAQGLGIGVSWGHTGRVEALLVRIGRGEVHPTSTGPPPGESWTRGEARRCGRGSESGGRRGRGRRRGRRRDAPNAPTAPEDDNHRGTT